MNRVGERRLSVSRLRRVVWEIVEVADENKADTYTVSKWFDVVILSLIAVNVVALVAESVEVIGLAAAPIFGALNVVTVIVFSAEYLARLWSCTASELFRHPITGRLRYSTRPLLIIDLLAVLPFYLVFIGADLVALRALRLAYVFRIAKVTRYMSSLQMIGRVFNRKREELIVTASVIGLLLIISATLMYFAERTAQPDLFTSIPATMWYSIATLTTVGYGDVYPITAIGRVMGALTAVIGVGFFALPTGILGSGFVDELAERRAAEAAAKVAAAAEERCPHCGKHLH